MRLAVLRSAFVLIVLAATVRARAQEKTSIPFDRADTAVVRALAAKADIDVLNVPLQDFMKALAKDHGITIRLDKSGLKRAGVAPSMRITASFKQVPLGLALQQILRPLKLQHRAADGVVVIEDLGLPLDAAHPPGSGPVGPQKGGQELIEQLVAPMRRAPAVRVAPAIRVANVNRLNRQSSLHELRLILQVELNFLQGVCTPTAEEMQQIKQEGLKQIADLAKGRLPDNNGRRVVNDLRRSVQQKLVELVRTRLSPERATRFESEIQMRSANLRHACACNLVVALDQELSLSEWQRQKLCTELADNWDDSWTTTVVLGSTNALGFLPNVPDELVVPYLDAAQRTLWNSLAKRGNMVWGGAAAAFLGMGAPALEDKE
jgi:predicted HicB family RNase H-like nuclease